MANMTVTPTSVQKATETLENWLVGQETQTFFSDTGAVVLTDDAVYEVYSYDEGIIIQSRDLERANGWDDITGHVLK